MSRELEGWGSSWVWASTAGRLTVSHSDVRDSPWGCDKMTIESCLGRKSLFGSVWGTGMWGCWWHYIRSGSREIKCGCSVHFLLFWQPRTPGHGMESLTLQTDLPPSITLSRNSLTSVVCILGDHRWRQHFIVSSEAWFCWFCHGEISACASWGLQSLH